MSSEAIRFSASLPPPARDGGTASGAGMQSDGAKAAELGLLTAVAASFFAWSQRYVVSSMADNVLDKAWEHTGKRLTGKEKPTLDTLDALPNPGLAGVADRIESAVLGNDARWPSIFNVYDGALEKVPRLGDYLKPETAPEAVRQVRDNLKQTFGQVGKPSAVVQKLGLPEAIRRAVVFDNFRGMVTNAKAGNWFSLGAGAMALGLFGKSLWDHVQKAHTAALERAEAEPQKRDDVKTSTALGAASAVGKGVACWEASNIGLMFGRNAARCTGLPGWASTLVGIAAGSTLAVGTRQTLNRLENAVVDGFTHDDPPSGAVA